MDLEDEIHVLHGIGLAHTALVAGLIAALREKGILSRAEVGAVFDIALEGAEASEGLSPQAIAQARKLIEIIGGQLLPSPHAKGRR